MFSVRHFVIIVLFTFLYLPYLDAQKDYWQQRADYNITIDFNHEANSYNGIQDIIYSNNSPDTLSELYFHLYFNAFQPGSDMDIHAQNIPDPQHELDFKIKYLTSAEMGYMYVNQVLIDSRIMESELFGSILKVYLQTPVLPGEQKKLTLSYRAQVPEMTRRTGRNNPEGIDYSMAQWFPKICVYDENGWQATPYIGREFYSNFGDYNVNIRIDSSYILAAGADSFSVEKIDSSSKNLWKFKSTNAIDFAWAADRDFQQYQLKLEDDITLNFYYLEAYNQDMKWQKLGDILKQVFPYINNQFGKYPYQNFTFIQAGDGGMEYPKCTFMTADRNFGSVVGTGLHELMHAWYQSTIATQENMYAWMDEGFANYATTKIQSYMAQNGILFDSTQNFTQNAYKSYSLLASSGIEEKMNTPANFYLTNTAYGIASYAKGELFLRQLEYIVGETKMHEIMLKYYENWKFKHPQPEDFIIIAEAISGLKLDWFLYYWTDTTYPIDYSIGLDTVETDQTKIRLFRKGLIPMPIDLEIRYKDGSKIVFLIPIDLMFGNKDIDGENAELLLETWRWTQPIYEIVLRSSLDEIESIRIDPSDRLADVDKSNNSWLSSSEGK